MRRWIGLAAALVAVAAAAASAAPRATRVQGRVEIRPPGAEWRAVTPGAEIAEGARIQTSLGSRLEIALDDGSVTTLRENSIFEVLRASNGRYEFRLWIGGLRNRVRPISPGGDYTVRTPIATAGVRGTDFDMGVVDDGTTGLRVYEGSVFFRSDISDQSVVVGAGNASTAGPDGSVTPPAALRGGPPNDDAFEAGGASAGAARTAAPVEIRIDEPRDGAVVGGGSISVVGTAAPGARLRVAGGEVVCDAAGRFAATVALRDGANVIVVETDDGASRAEVTVLVDATVPTIATSIPNGHLTNQPSVTLTVTTAPDATVTVGGQSAVATGGQATFTLSLVEGENLVTIGVAAPNGKTASQTLYIVLDTLAPRTTIFSTSNVTGGVRISGVTEPGVTVTANGYPLQVRADGSFDDVVSGLEVPVTIEARDAAGNITREVRSIEGAIDVDAPVFVSLAYAPTTVEAGASTDATLQVSDASDVQPTVTLSLTGPGGAQISGTLTASGRTYVGAIRVPASAASGTYATDAFTVADALGNAATYHPAVSVTVQNNAPTASVSAVDARTGGNVTVSWSSPDADVAWFTVREATTGTIVYEGPSAGTVGLTGRNNASYTYEATAKDLAGNVSLAATALVTITDQDPPTAPGTPTASPGGAVGRARTSSRGRRRPTPRRRRRIRRCSGTDSRWRSATAPSRPSPRPTGCSRSRSRSRPGRCTGSASRRATRPGTGARHRAS